MEITCDIVTDLIEIYHNGLASRDSKEAVEKHLKNCSSCKKYYEIYKNTLKKSNNEIAIDFIEPDEKKINKNALELSKRIRRKKFVTGVTTNTILGIGAGMFALGVYLISKNKGKY